MSGSRASSHSGLSRPGVSAEWDIVEENYSQGSIESEESDAVIIFGGPANNKPFQQAHLGTSSGNSSIRRGENGHIDGERSTVLSLGNCEYVKISAKTRCTTRFPHFEIGALFVSWDLIWGVSGSSLRMKFVSGNVVWRPSRSRFP